MEFLFANFYLHIHVCEDKWQKTWELRGKNHFLECHCWYNFYNYGIPDVRSDLETESAFGIYQSFIQHLKWKT